VKVQCGFGLLTLDMSSDWKRAKHAGRRPLDGRVGRCGPQGDSWTTLLDNAELNGQLTQRMESGRHARFFLHWKVRKAMRKR